MHKYTITLTTNEKLTPGNANQLGSIIMNPASRNRITIEESED